MQPKLKSKVRFADREVGEVTRVIVDPLSCDVSHIVVGGDGAGRQERQIPVAQAASITEHTIELRGSAADFERFPAFRREEYVSIKEVEIAHLEESLHVEPGEVLVPYPELERGVKRRSFFTSFTNAIGMMLALPLAYPVLKYIMKPMYAPFDNAWIKIGNISKIKSEDVGMQFKFKREFTEGVVTREVEKGHWVLKASPAVLQEVYGGKDMEFRDPRGNLIWTNRQDVPYVVYSGKCPHLGCGYKWRNVPKLGRQIFLCPCHISIYEPSGKVISGPAPRGLDVLPIRVSANGNIEVIDMEFKAGRKDQARIV